MNDSQHDFEIVREFGISHSDFFRIIPRFETDIEQISDRIVAIFRRDNRRLEIELSAEKIRKLATLRIPYVDITFRFLGWNDSQRAEFFEVFDRAFQKGGG